MSKRNLLKPGSISSGSLRPEDVVPELLWTLEHRTDKRGAVKARKLRREWEAQEGREDREVEDAIWQEAIEALETYAPPFCYVGAIEGDGADIGVWLSEDALAEAIREGEVWPERDCDCQVADVEPWFAGKHIRGEHWKLDPLDPRQRGHHLGECASRMPKGASFRLVTSDHGNQTLYDRKGREVW